MLEDLLARQESKTLEFKESAKSLPKIIQTVIAFANTAGGMIVIGIQDKTKNVIGVENILQDEERIASAIADSVSPTLLPNLQFISWRNKDVLIVTVPHSPGPFYLKSKGEHEGVYIRLGSTNRIADAALIAEIKRLKEHTSFDQLPELKASPFDGTTKTTAIDHIDIRSAFPLAIDEILAFIRRNTSMKAVIRSARREDIPQYPLEAVREAVINALLHADYSTMRSSIQVAIFDDRMEITNPGPLPLGLNLETALSGVSQLRNKVLGRVFRELELIEQWGSGLNRINGSCIQHGATPPKFEELDLFFRVTLYPRTVHAKPQHPWYSLLLAHIQQHNQVSVVEASKLWNVSSRTATTRLKLLCQERLLIEVSKGPFDPYKAFILSKPGSSIK